MSSQLLIVAPKAAKYAPFLDEAMHEGGLITALRQAHFFAQAAHETMGFQYSREIWGPTPTQLKYEGRSGLGNNQPGDGKRFLGRGIFMVTGRANYATLSQALYGDNRLIETPGLLEEPEAASKSAVWYWNARNLSPLADKDDFVSITHKINGGENGLADRAQWLLKFKTAFGI